VPLFAIERWAPEESSQWPAIFECYDKISAMLRLHQIHQVINHLTVHSSWDALGRSQLREKLEQLHVAITQKFYKNSSWIVDIAWFLSFWNQQFDAYLALPSRYFVETFTLINQLELLLKMR
jgi:NAD-specific glutamate dehydrogenase